MTIEDGTQPGVGTTKHLPSTEIIPPQGSVNHKPAPRKEKQKKTKADSDLRFSIDPSTSSSTALSRRAVPRAAPTLGFAAILRIWPPELCPYIPDFRVSIARFDQPRSADLQQPSAVLPPRRPTCAAAPSSAHLPSFRLVYTPQGAHRPARSQ